MDEFSACTSDLNLDANAARAETFGTFPRKVQERENFTGEKFFDLEEK